MPRLVLMTWIRSQKRWTRMYRGVRYYVSPRQLGTPETRAGSMAAANEWWRRKQEEIQAPFVQTREDLESIRDHIGEEVFEELLRWIIHRGEPEYLRRAQEMIEFLTRFHRETQASLPGEGSGEGLDEFV